MGCDGGTIPTRDELVRLKKKPEQKDKDSERAFKWKHCAISQEPLRCPVVACEMGYLYNKESVIELILDRSKFPGSSRFNHIKGLKDVKTLQLSDNPAYRDPEGDKGGAYIDRNTAKYICPMTGLEMSGKYRFCFLYKCGCVFAERALKEIKTETCNKCGLPFLKDDIVLLNGSEEEQDDLQQRMEARRAKAKLEKKAKKKHKLEEASATAATNGETSTDGTEEPATKQAKVEVDPKATNGKLSAVGAKAKEAAATDKKYKSIQQDPKASSTYKSLFTTSEKAKSQPQGHWVTFNPQYF